MNKISVVAENPESTVVAEYQGMKTKQTEYQSEADLEKAFIKQLQNQAYDYLPIHSEKALIDNVQDTLQNKAMKLYQKCIAKPDSSLAARCCDFKMLEEKCSSYSDT